MTALKSPDELPFTCRRTSFTFVCRVEASGPLAAEAETVQVAYDYSACTSVAVSDDLRARLSTLLLT